MSGSGGSKFVIGACGKPVCHDGSCLIVHVQETNQNTPYHLTVLSPSTRVSFPSIPRSPVFQDPLLKAFELKKSAVDVAARELMVAYKKRGAEVALLEEENDRLEKKNDRLVKEVAELKKEKVGLAMEEAQKSKEVDRLEAEKADLLDRAEHAEGYADICAKKRGTEREHLNLSYKLWMDSSNAICEEQPANNMLSIKKLLGPSGPEVNLFRERKGGVNVAFFQKKPTDVEQFTKACKKVVEDGEDDGPAAGKGVEDWDFEARDHWERSSLAESRIFCVAGR